jgi:opacity protein-like surface antigen
MIERAFSRFFAPLLCASLIPAAALAQTQSKGFYVTIYGQHSQIGSSNTNESGALGGGSGLRAEFGSGTGFGGDIGYRYGNGWAAELEWNYRRHSLDRLLQGSSNLARDGDFASNILLINGLRRFAAKGAWTPYAGAGIGWVQEIDIDISPSSGSAERGYSSSSKIALQLIGGVEYTLTPQWRLTADARWLRAGSVRLNNEVGNPGGSAGPLKYNPLSVQVGIRRSF